MKRAFFVVAKNEASFESQGLFFAWRARAESVCRNIFQYGFLGKIVQVENGVIQLDEDYPDVLVVPPVYPLVEPAIRLKNKVSCSLVLDAIERISNELWEYVRDYVDLVIFPTKKAVRRFAEAASFRSDFISVVYDSFEQDCAKSLVVPPKKFCLHIIAEKQHPKIFSEIEAIMFDIADRLGGSKDELQLSFYSLEHKASELLQLSNWRVTKDAFEFRPSVVVILDLGGSEAFVRKVTIEALGLKIPTVAVSSSEDIFDIVIFERTGAIVSPSDFTAFEEAMRYIYELYLKGKFVSCIEPRRWGFFSSIIQAAAYVSGLERAILNRKRR